MITVLSRKPDDLASPDVSKVNKEIIEYCGLSTDEKPNGLIVTGSTFLEIDTGDLYIYNEEAAEWVQFINIKDAAGGGGGGNTPVDITLYDGSFTATETEGRYVYTISWDIDPGECFWYAPVLLNPLNIEFDGVLYENVVPVYLDGAAAVYGDPENLSEYPFGAVFGADIGMNTEVIVSDEQEHNMKISCSWKAGSLTFTNSSGADAYLSDMKESMNSGFATGQTKDIPVILINNSAWYLVSGDALGAPVVGASENAELDVETLNMPAIHITGTNASITLLGGSPK